MNTSRENFYELHGVPPPEALEQLATQLPDVPDLDLSDYAGTIRILHDQKGQSFRQIVDFLAGHGIEASRSAVYRVYKDTSQGGPDDPLIDDETGEVIEP